MFVFWGGRGVAGQTSLPPRSAAELATVDSGHFLLGWAAADLPAQGLAYLPEEKILLRWVFPHAEPTFLAEVAEPICRSFRGNAGPWREFAIFGLALRLPAAFALEDMNALPANLMMAFENRRQGRVVCRRWGLPEVVLRGLPLAEFYCNFLRHQGCHDLQAVAATVGGHAAVRTSFSQRGQYQMDRFMGRLWRQGQAVLWFDSREKRLYACEQIGPNAVVPLEFADIFPRLGPIAEGCHGQA